MLIDDVWSGGKKVDGPYPLMSTAIAAGLYHPRCKDSHTTHFPGISTADNTWTKEELEAIERLTSGRQEGSCTAGGKIREAGRVFLHPKIKEISAKEKQSGNKDLHSIGKLI